MAEKIGGKKKIENGVTHRKKSPSKTQRKVQGRNRNIRTTRNIIQKEKLVKKKHQWV